MTKSDIKYEIANGDDEQEYYQTVQDFQLPVKSKTSIFRQILNTTLLISAYFVLSVGLTFYLRWLYSTYGIRYPLAVVLCHLFIKFALSGLIRCIRRYFRPQVYVPWKSIVQSLAPPGIASGFDVGLSNWALSLITISLYTMTKSTTIIFILGFSLIFKLEKKSWSLVGIVVMISIGLTMFTYKSTQFHFFGFVLCLLASFSSGIRWTMAQIIMQKSKLGLHNPVDMIYHMQPWMLIAILPIAVWFEGDVVYNDLSNADWQNSSRVIAVTSAVVGSALLAFSMEIAEFLVVTYTSSLTLSITGIFKEIFTLVLAVEWKGDPMSGLNFVGLLVCLGGIILHIIKKTVCGKKTDDEDPLEMQNPNSVPNVRKMDDATDTPLLMQKSSSLTNLLNGSYSSDEDNDAKSENSSQILFHVLQRREQT